MPKETKKQKTENRGPRIALHVFAILLLSVITTFIALFIIVQDIEFFKNEIMLTVIAVIVSFVLFTAQYVHIKFLKSKSGTVSRTRQLVMIFSVMFITVVLSMTAAKYLSLFALPIVLTPILLTILIGRTESIVATILTSMMIFLYFLVALPYQGQAASGDIIAAGLSVIISVVEGILMIFILKNGYSRFKIIWGNMIVAVCMVPFAALCSAVEDTAAVSIGMAALWSFAGSAIAIFLSFALLPVYEYVFNVWTDFKTSEQTSFKQPLLKELAEKAPGTFNHSLVVGNLAESCAIAIGENPFMARAAAYYHDIGKIKQPEFFVENQADGYNPHDDLIPEVSVSMIKKHARQGEEILRSHRMPEEITKVALEHHGTSPVMYFYLKAQGITEGKLDAKEYCYDGPKPSSKISAIVMIADSVEAATRSMGTLTTEELSNFVQNVINDKIARKQFDECDITLQDLNKIHDVIVSVIPSIHHKRIQYQNQEEMKETPDLQQEEK